MADFVSVAKVLKGVTVIEFCQVLAGPYCCEVLADMGADVIKIERPRIGDASRRGWGTMQSSEASAPFVAVNRNKRSLTLDVSDKSGKAIFRRLTRDADVVVENLRPGVMSRLGLDYTELSKDNPSLIYASISGFGQTGPYAQRPGYDIVAQAASGVMSVTGSPGGEPAKAGVPVADIGAGTFAAIGILAALVERSRTGAGQYLDTSLYEAALTFAVWEASEYWATGAVPGPLGSRHRLNAPYQALRVSDGYIAVAANTEGFWARLCAAIGRDDLFADPRFASNRDRLLHIKELSDELERSLATGTVAYWVERLLAADVPAGPVRNYAEVLSDPHTIAREMVVEMELSDGHVLRSIGLPVKFDGLSASARRPPPTLGQHTDEVLSHLGYSTVQIDTFRSTGVI